MANTRHARRPASRGGHKDALPATEAGTGHDGVDGPARVPVGAVHGLWRG